MAGQPADGRSAGFPFAFEAAVSAAARERAEAALTTAPPGTRRALLSVARGYLRWCRAATPDVAALPIGAARLGAYLDHVQATRSPASRSLHRWGLERWHALLDLASPDVGELAVPLPSPRTAEPPDLPVELEDRLRAYYTEARDAFAPATRRALASDLRLFQRWCAEHDRSWLPATAETVRAYLLDVGEQRKPATIGRYLSSIGAAHQAAGLPSPCVERPVRLARRAHARAMSVRQRQASPVGNAELALIFARMDRPGPPEARPRLIDLRDRALLLVGRDTLARADELAALRWDDLAMLDPARDPEARTGEGTIRIRRSKTDQEGQGAVAWLSTETMAALASWRMAVEAALDPATGRPAGAGVFLFRSLARRGYGKRLRAADVRDIVARRMATESAQTAGYGGHSLRVGAAQDLLAAGVDLAGLMQAGRWKTERMPARYTEELRASRGAVARVRRAEAANRQNSQPVAEPETGSGDEAG